MRSAVLIILMWMLTFPGLAQEKTPKEAADSLYGAGDMKGAFAAYHALAEAGDVEAMRRMGEMIYFGQGTKKDDDVALQWSLLAAENGDRIAMYNVGYIYENGSGSLRTIDTAITWYSKSATLNYSEAQYRLGRILEPSNPTVAAQWYSLAQQQGHQKAAEHLRKVGGQMSAERERRREQEVADRRADRAVEMAESEQRERDRVEGDERQRRRDAESAQALEGAVKQFKNTIGVIGHVPTLAPKSGREGVSQGQADAMLSQCVSRCGGTPGAGVAQRKFYEHAACVCSCMGDSACYEENYRKARQLGSNAPSVR